MLTILSIQIDSKSESDREQWPTMNRRGALVPDGGSTKRQNGRLIESR